MIFQAMGARYSLGRALRVFFATGTAADTRRLKRELFLRYEGEVTVYRKGRAALAEAIRLATGGTGEVAISGLTCYSVVQAVEAAGCTPVYVDINEENLNFGEVELTKAYKKHPAIRAIVIQNMLGIPADIKAIESFARKHELPIIEDLAHSAGSRYADGREVGTVGDFTMLSFGRDKALDAVNGGALIVRSTGYPRAHEPRRAVRLGDQIRDRIYPLLAWKARKLYPIGLGRYLMAGALKLKLVIRSADGAVIVDEGLPRWQARLACDELMRLDQTVRERRSIVSCYEKHHIEGALPAAFGSGVSLVRLPVLRDDRDALVRRLSVAGIQANDIWYDIPVSPQRFYNRTNFPTDECPVAVRIAAQLMNLPAHRNISTADVKRIAEVLGEKL